MTFYNHAEFHMTHKRAEIDAEERRLIDEAVAAGKVQKIPTGQSFFAEEYVWKGDEKSDYIGRLEPKYPMTRAKALAKFKAGNRSAGFQPNHSVAKRRVDVLNLTNEGLTAKQIASHLNCSEAQVKNDREALREEGKLGKITSQGGTSEEIEARRKEVLRLIGEGLLSKDIAVKLGVPRSRIMNDREALIKQGRLRKRVMKNGVWT